tara:strand:+ start:277 stop:555 length:279 start_codon:yes stop_codon:yes gene_type:complete
MELMSIDNLKNHMLELPEWRLENESLIKEFKFENYMASITFVNRLAEKAEEHNHHPDLEIGWCRVVVTFTSHDSGGVTDLDIMMVKITEELI